MLPLLRLSVPARPEGIGHRHHGGEYGVQDEAVRGDGVGGFSVGQEKGDGGHQHVACKDGEVPEAGDDAFQMQRSLRVGEFEASGAEQDLGNGEHAVGDQLPRDGSPFGWLSLSC